MCLDCFGLWLLIKFIHFEIRFGLLLRYTDCYAYWLFSLLSMCCFIIGSFSCWCFFSFTLNSLAHSKYVLNFCCCETREWDRLHYFSSTSIYTRIHAQILILTQSKSCRSRFSSGFLCFMSFFFDDDHDNFTIATEARRAGRQKRTVKNGNFSIR